MITSQIIIGFAPHPKSACLPLEYLEKRMDAEPETLADKIMAGVANTMTWLMGNKKDDNAIGCLERFQDYLMECRDKWDNFSFHDLIKKEEKIAPMNVPSTDTRVNSISDDVVPFQQNM
jgi:hypothetical protein